jgi:hypothetical protein
MYVAKPLAVPEGRNKKIKQDKASSHPLRGEYFVLTITIIYENGDGDVTLA